MPNPGNNVAFKAFMLAAFVAGCSNNELPVSTTVPTQAEWKKEDGDLKVDGYYLNHNGNVYFGHIDWQGQTVIDEIYCGPAAKINLADLTPGHSCPAFAASAPMTLTKALNEHFNGGKWGKYGKTGATLTVSDAQLDPFGSGCGGDCLPVAMNWCGDAFNSNGTPYEGMWNCTPYYDENGVCHTSATRMDCATGTECKFQGLNKFPAYFVCEALPVCSADADCVTDANQCTDQKCINGTCQTTLNLGGVCNDADACTSGDKCVNGMCEGTAVTCTDSNPCTTSTCNSVTGCVHTNVADNTVCSDSSACTSGDKCLSGVCTATNLVCDDANGCTTDSCSAATGCQHLSLPNSAQCSDGNPCTTNDACFAGVCQSVAVSCDDGDPCTLDTCVPNGVTSSCSNLAMVDGSACGATASATICVDGECLDQDDTCVFTSAEIASGNARESMCVGVPTNYWWTCEPNPGSNYGVWEAALQCKKAVCIDDKGCACDTSADCASPFTCVGAATGVPGYCSNNACTTSAQCDDGKSCTTDTCLASGTCSNVVNCTGTQACNASGACAAPPACTPSCSAKVCGDDGCGATCGSCSGGQLCNTSGQCVAPPASCSTTSPCPTGQTCWNNSCYTFVDQFGFTDAGQSGANGGGPDGKFDSVDQDGDCYCAARPPAAGQPSPCIGTTAPAGACPTLQGGDCDEQGSGNHPGATDWDETPNYDNACAGGTFK